MSATSKHRLLGSLALRIVLKLSDAASRCSILAAYDLGASAGHLRTIYADAVKNQRPKFVEEQDKTINVDKENWKQYLGNQKCVHRARLLPL